MTTSSAAVERLAPEVTRPLLEVHGLIKAFGGIRAIDGLDVSIMPGEVRCIIGPNGAGKSTFFKLLIGTYRPDSGTIRYDGREITQTHPFERARMGITSKWQTLGIFPDLSVRHNVIVALGPGAQSRSVDNAVDAILERVSLRKHADDLARQISHGEQQWLEIGMALAMKPKLLLLDEPTAGLSRDETRATGGLVAAISAEGIAVVVIEHDMAFVRQLDAPTTVLHQGRVFAEGTHAEIEQHEEVKRIYLGRSQSR